MNKNIISDLEKLFGGTMPKGFENEANIDGREYRRGFDSGHANNSNKLCSMCQGVSSSSAANCEYCTRPFDKELTWLPVEDDWPYSFVAETNEMIRDYELGFGGDDTTPLR